LEVSLKISHHATLAGIAMCLGVATAAAPFAAGAAAMGSAAKPLLEERGAVVNATTSAAAINRILDRWQPVTAVLKQDTRVWRSQFGALLEQVSPATLQSIDAMDATPGSANRTLAKLYETAYMAAVSDVGTRFAAQVRAAKTAAKLGPGSTDLEFVPILPCRIVDTRNLGPGNGITAGTQKNYYYYSDGTTPPSWSTQGGVPGPVATGCPNTVLGGTLGNAAPAAIMANITAVNTTAPGNFIGWGGSPTVIPNTSVLNWDHAGEIIANTTVIPWGGRTGGNLDFTIRYNGPSGASDVVVDVMGYFVENAATSLQCVTATASATIPIGTGTDTAIAYPACPTGYAKTGGYCNGAGGAATSGIYLVESGEANCIFRNLGGATPTGSAISQCCRVPGR
jgi:hypothetical protein